MIHIFHENPYKYSEMISSSKGSYYYCSLYDRNKYDYQFQKKKITIKFMEKNMLDWMEKIPARITIIIIHDIDYVLN